MLATGLISHLSVLRSYSEKPKGCSKACVRVCLWRETAAAERAQPAKPMGCNPPVSIKTSNHRLFAPVLPSDVMMHDWLGSRLQVFAEREFQALFPDVIAYNLLVLQLSSW